MLGSYRSALSELEISKRKTLTACLVSCNQRYQPLNKKTESASQDPVLKIYIVQVYTWTIYTVNQKSRQQDSKFAITKVKVFASKAEDTQGRKSAPVFSFVCLQPKERTSNRFSRNWSHNKFREYRSRCGDLSCPYK